MSMNSPGTKLVTTSVKIRLDRALPLVCIVCGEPAEKYFSITLPKTNPQNEQDSSQVAAAVVVGVVTTAILGKPHIHVEGEKVSNPVRIPLCSEHRHFRRAYVLRSFLGGMYVLASLLCVILALAQVTARGAAGGSIVIASLLLVAAIVFALLASSINKRLKKELSIRCHSVSDQRMVLEGVAVQFAKAVKEKTVKETKHVDSFLDDLQ